MLEESDKWADIVAALESKPVKDVAEEFGTTPGAITLALVRTNTTREPVQGTGAPPPAKKRRARKKREEPKVSEQNGLHIRKGTKDAEIAKFADLLGKEPDNVIADKAGVTARTVATFRRRNGIKGRRGRGPSKSKAKTETKAALPPEKSAGKKKKLRSRGKPSKLDPYMHLLGTMPDAEVAEMAGVSANAAAAYRRRRNIASFRDNKSSAAEEAPAAADAPAKADKPKKASKGRGSSKKSAAPSAAGKVFRVALADGEVAFVLAGDLVEAATQVDGKKGVVGVAYAGELLG